jgi:hypothetical protein
MMNAGEYKRYSILVLNLPEEYNQIGILHSYFARFGNIQKVNCDLERKSAMIKFKEIHEAEAAASAYFNRPRDTYILDLPQVKIKYVLNPGVAPGVEDNSPDCHQRGAPPMTKEQEEALRLKRLNDMKRDNELKRKALIE